MILFFLVVIQTVFPTHENVPLSISVQKALKTDVFKAFVTFMIKTKICLTKLKAETKDGHLEDLPDLCDIVIFPDCKKVNKTK